ncbi:MAG: MerR family transcriptional regulator [Salinarimonadaceae bacterium]|nr:MAG: MerR family transcriptional regulator [Salinarimonadaceae bacterium]
MDKSPDAFRTISEVAEELDLPQHVLRFWETKFPQIKPLKRGGGRRYYRPRDIDLLKGIRTLLYAEGYTIKGVQRILKSEGVRAVEAMGRGDMAMARRIGETQDESPAPEIDDEPFDEGEDVDAPEPRPAGSGRTGERRAGGASDLDIGQLRAALAELRECKRLLDNLRPAADSEN